MSALSWLRHKLLPWARRRDPDFVIGEPGDPYLRRWYVLPRNRVFNVYLHEIRQSDDDRALHDHPWLNVSIVLSGRYTEVLPIEQAQPSALDYSPHGVYRVVRAVGSVVVRRPSSAHRLEIDHGPCWSLFLTGPVWRAWGFRCAKGWRHHEVFTDPDSRGRVGRGCA